MKQLSEQELQALETIRNISHESIERIHNVFLALQTYAFLQYSEGEPVVVPYFGNFILKYKGDTISDEGREAVIESFFAPSDMMKENIGASEDYKVNPKKGISSIPIFKHFETMNERQLKKELNDEIIKELEED